MLPSERIRRPPHPELTRGERPPPSAEVRFALRFEREATSSKRMASLNVLFRDTPSDDRGSSDMGTLDALDPAFIVSVRELKRPRPKGVALVGETEAEGMVSLMSFPCACSSREGLTFSLSIELRTSPCSKLFLEAGSSRLAWGTEEVIPGAGETFVSDVGFGVSNTVRYAFKNATRASFGASWGSDNVEVFALPEFTADRAAKITAF